MPAPLDATPESWHKFFGSTANNRAWDLVESPTDSISPSELLDAAHAAAWHWRQVGTERQQMRALMLLAAAHAKMGLGATALAYAETMRGFFLATPDTPDWEIAFTHAVHAHAAYAAGDCSQHAASYAQAVKSAAAIGDPEDRAIVDRVLCRVPAP